MIPNQRGYKENGYVFICNREIIKTKQTKK